MKKLLSLVLAIAIMVCVVPFGAFTLTASAATSGKYTYTVSNGEATITDVSETISGAITIPSTLGGYPVTSIGDYAFEDCDSLTSITIPNSVTSIGQAFCGCTSLESITLPFVGSSRTANKSYDSVFGYIFGYTTSSTVSGTVKQKYYAYMYYYYGTEYIEEKYGYYYIPSSIKTVNITDTTQIPYGAFYGCNNITSVAIPNSVTSIGSSAFSYCASLTAVYYGGSYADRLQINISYDNDKLTGAKWNYSDKEPLAYSLNEATLTASVIDCEPYATAVTIPKKISKGGKTYTVTSIVDDAFYNCTSLKSITIPTSVTSIGSSAFCYCASLTAVYYGGSYADKLQISIGNRNGNLTDAKWNYSDKEPLVYSLNEATLTASVIDCEPYATAVTIPKKISKGGKTYTVTSIVDDAFYNCTSLKSITIPTSVTSIGSSAFSSCESLTSVTIPNSVKSIGDSAFRYCTSLKSITIPKSVTSIGNYVFGHCTSLEKITLPFVGQNADGTGFTNFGYIFGACDDSYPEYDNAKYVPSSLKSVVVTGNTNIAEDAFYGCSYITNVSFTGNVKVIDNWAFNGCNGLKKVTLPSSLKRINSMVFYDCINLTDVYFCGSKSAKNDITIKHGNDPLYDADWYYSSCIGAKSHKYKTTTTTKATLSKNGSVTKKCTVCGKTSKGTIKYAKSFKLTTTNYTYNGKVKTPGVIVKDSAGKTLKKNTDYTVSYAKGRKNVGTYKVIIKMKGNYSGTKTLTFKINPISISKCKLALSTKTYIYNGKVKTPSVTVKNESGTKLKKGTDYTVTYSKGRKNIGTYKVMVKMKGKYSGTKTLTFKIKLAKIDSCKLSATSYAYDGKVKTPSVTVKNADGTKLTKNTHYTVTYSKGRKDVGTYKVVIKGKGNYTGSKTLIFKIKEDSTKKCKFKLSSTSYIYDGKVKTPSVKVTFGSKTLKKGTDYTVKYASGRKNVGTYKVTVILKGKYYGTKTLNFNIKSRIETGKEYSASYSADDDCNVISLIFYDDGTVESGWTYYSKSKSKALSDEKFDIWGEKFYCVGSSEFVTRKYKTSGKIITVYGVTGSDDEDTITNKFEKLSNGSLKTIYSNGSEILDGLYLHLQVVNKIK